MTTEDSIRRFVEHDYARVVNVVALITGDRAAAEDAVQEALARAWARRRTRDVFPLAPWVTTVALNLARSRWRRLKVERTHAPALRPEPVDPPSPSRVDIEAAIAALPRRQREVVVLRYLLQLSTYETARALGVGEGTVKNSLAKARAALAVSLRVDDEDAPAAEEVT